MKNLSKLCCQIVCVTPLVFALSAHAGTRAWEFDLGKPGTYLVQVQYDYRGASPPGTVATYSFQSSEKTLTQDDPYFMPGKPALPFRIDLANPQHARVVISGLPEAILRQASVYVIDRNSKYPDEWFDPGKSVNLNEAIHIRNMLKQPESKIDLARAELIINQMIDPSIDVEANLRKIDAMLVQIEAMPGFAASSTAKMLAIKRYLYEPGTWNNDQSYRYDLDDPMGTRLGNKLLPHYLDSKKGNCVSMPLLFVVLGQRLGIDVTASTAPLHVLVKFKGESGTWMNLETTSGANPARDVWYREQTPMTDQAIANGVYMQPLTRKETVAVMATTLAEHYVEQHEFEKAITIADLILEYYPKHVDVMVLKGSAYYALMDKYYFKRYPSPDAIPEKYRGHYEYLSQNNIEWFAKAEALGWREETKTDNEKYLQRVGQDRKNNPAN